MHIEMIYARINPKKNPNTVSKLPRPVYLIALLMALLINNIKKITITKIVIPSPTSSTYSLSITFLIYGLILGNSIKVIIYAKNHFDIESMLKTNPFL